MQFNRFGRNRNEITSREPLTNEQIQKYAPSAFAGQAHDSRSERYTFLPTSDVINGLRDAGFSPVQAMQSRSRVPGKEFFTKHMLRFRPDNSGVLAVGDSTPEILMVNSHDGTSSYQVMLGVFKFICGNGLVVAESMVESISIRHTGDIVNEVVKATLQIIKSGPVVAEAIRLWKSIELSPAEQLVLAEGALALRYEDEAPAVKPQALPLSRRYEDNSNDLYDVFNRIQENTVRGVTGVRGARRFQNYSEAGRRMSSREVKGIDQNTNLNRQLWALAEKMAAIKSGK